MPNPDLVKTTAVSNDGSYRAAICDKPHDDGTECRPSWDGHGYICTNWLGTLMESSNPRDIPLQWRREG